MGIIATPLGWIMKGCYYLVKNYGIALLLFTIITRLITFPLQVKQQKNMAKTSMLSPELEKLKKKYAKNPQKLQEEQMNLYAKANVNPMSSCLPSIITLVIVWALIPVVYGPLTYVSNINKDDVERSNNMIKNLYTVSSEVKANNTSLEELINGYKEQGKEPYEELENLFKDNENYSKSKKALDSSSAMEDVMQAIEKHNDIDKFMLNTEYISDKIVQSRPELMTFNIVDKLDGKYKDILPDNVREDAEKFNYEFLGIYLGKIPTWKDITCIIPILSFVFQVLVTIVSQHYSKKNNPDMVNMGGGMKIMLYGMSIFSLWIGFSYPAGLGLYWCFSSFIALGQTIVLNKIYTPEHVAELVQKDIAKQKKKGKSSFMEKMAEAQMIKDGKDPEELRKSIIEENGGDYEESRKKSKNEIKEEQRKRLNEARRRMAEKYGDEYSDNE